jgi:glycosyltransferase involved in cell wall biosynthesis
MFPNGRDEDAMRIGVDCLPLQSGASRNRGIGGYASDLLRAMAASDANTQLVLYVRSDLPRDRIPDGPTILQHPYTLEHHAGPTAIMSALEGNPDGLDALLLLSPFESHVAHRCNIGVVCSVVYDLIPDRYADKYLARPDARGAYECYIEAIREYDLLFAISAHTRRELIARRGIPGDRIVVLPAAVDHDRFRPIDRSGALPPAMVARGVRPPYVLHVGSMDPRKGGLDLIEAFGLLPRAIRKECQLVYSYNQSNNHEAELRALASQHDVQLLTTGFVPDDDLVALYQHCAALVFPSKAEGLGLPVLEAMACAAPVITGGNSALPELVGEAAALVDVSDKQAIMRAVHHLLTDPRRRTLMGHLGASRARNYTWPKAARVALGAIERAVASQGAKPHGRAVSTNAPELALFSCFPPVLSGISDYAIEVARSLSTRYRITLFHDPSERPELLDNLRLPVRPATEFDPIWWPRRLYQLGNNICHAFLLDALRAAPGVVTVHDLRLSELWRSAAEKYAGVTSAEEFLARVCAGSQIVVHDPSNLAQVPLALRATTHVVPFGARPNVLVAGRRAEVLASLGLDPSSRIIGCGGLIGDLKLSQDVVRAFDICRPEGWLLVYAGPEVDHGATRQLAEWLETPGVHFAGQVAPGMFADVIASFDLVVNLRRPPSNWESSATLFDALRAGVPAIVSDVGTFRNFPDDCVRKTIPRDIDSLASTIRDLTRDEPARRALGARGLAYVRQHHDDDRAAARYAEIIEASVVLSGRREMEAGRSTRSVPCPIEK